MSSNNEPQNLTFNVNIRIATDSESQQRTLGMQANRSRCSAHSRGPRNSVQGLAATSSSSCPACNLRAQGNRPTRLVTTNSGSQNCARNPGAAQRTAQRVCPNGSSRTGTAPLRTCFGLSPESNGTARPLLPASRSHADRLTGWHSAARGSENKSQLVRSLPVQGAAPQPTLDSRAAVPVAPRANSLHQGERCSLSREYQDDVIFSRSRIIGADCDFIIVDIHDSQATQAPPPVESRDSAAPAAPPPDSSGGSASRADLNLEPLDDEISDTTDSDDESLAALLRDIPDLVIESQEDASGYDNARGVCRRNPIREHQNCDLQ
jgi:hypothetical protein